MEEEDIKEAKNVEGNVEHIKKEYFKRKKEIHYDEVFLSLIGKKLMKKTLIMFFQRNYWKKNLRKNKFLKSQQLQ